MGRHPVDRIISYYYQRCYFSSTCVTYNRTFNSLTVQELEYLLKYFRTVESVCYNKDCYRIIVDDGMSEAACRVLTNHRKTTGMIVDDVDLTQYVIEDFPLATNLNDAINISITNLNQCVIGILENWADTKLVLNEWFPWIDLDSKDPDRKRMTIVGDKETKDTLRPELAELIKIKNPCDMKIYHAMLQRFELQMKVIHSLLSESHTLKSAYQLPVTQHIPSPQDPFVFLHIEKCAGSTLREFIVESSQRLDLQFFVPCHGLIHCSTTSLSPSKIILNDIYPVTCSSETNNTQQQVGSIINIENVSVVAGHFAWNVWKELPSFMNKVNASINFIENITEEMSN